MKNREILLAELIQPLVIRKPTIRWETIQIGSKPLGCEGKCWKVTAFVEFEDPDSVASYIHWPAESKGPDQYDPSHEKGRIELSESFWIDQPLSAMLQFQGTVTRYGCEIAHTAAEVARFDSAVPYLLSAWIEGRVHGMPVTRGSRPLGWRH